MPRFISYKAQKEIKRTRLKAYILALIGTLWLAPAFAQGGMGPGPGTVHSTGASFAVSKKGTSANTSNASTTLSAWTTGWGSGCNLALVGIAYNTASGDTVSALTLDGSQSATKITTPTSSQANNTANNDGAVFFYVANPTGSTGTPTITFSSTFSFGAVGLQLWCITTSTTTPSGGGASPPTSFAANTTCAVTVPTGGAIFAMSSANGSMGGGPTFTNAGTGVAAIVVPNQFGPADVGTGYATGGAGSSVTVTAADGAGDNGAWVCSVAAVAP